MFIACNISTISALNISKENVTICDDAVDAYVTVDYTADFTGNNLEYSTEVSISGVPDRHNVKEGFTVEITYNINIPIPKEGIKLDVYLTLEVVLANYLGIPKYSRVESFTTYRNESEVGDSWIETFTDTHTWPAFGSGGMGYVQFLADSDILIIVSEWIEYGGREYWDNEESYSNNDNEEQFITFNKHKRSMLFQNLYCLPIAEKLLERLRFLFS
jgi:hypothetical protein